MQGFVCVAVQQKLAFLSWKLQANRDRVNKPERQALRLSVRHAHAPEDAP
jgi:hypothetical protein